MASFYTFQTDDFITILAVKLRKGDLLAFGEGSPALGKYGVIRVDDVQHIDRGWIVVWYTLPPGATIGTGPEGRDIYIKKWKGNSPIVTVSDTQDAYSQVLIRPREK